MVGGIVEGLDQWLTELSVPGASVVIASHDGVVVQVAGVGNADAAWPVVEGTVFDAASLTKPVFAALVRRLVSEGRFDVDRPLADYWCDDVLAADPRHRLVTARLALGHAAGLDARRADGLFIPGSTPGAAWRYSGQGYEWVQRAVESATGSGLEALIQAELFTPLGMTSSSLVWQPDYDDLAATGHNREGETMIVVRTTEPFAWASLRTTPGDYGRFLQVELGEADLTPVVGIDDELGWACGWGLERVGDRVLGWQWGDNPGCKNFAAIAPGEVAVAVFTNGDRGAELHGRVVTRVLPGRHPALARQLRPRWQLAMATRPVDLDDRRDELAAAGLLPKGPPAGRQRVVGYLTDHRWAPLGLGEDVPLAAAVVDLDTAELASIAVLPTIRRRGIARGLAYGILARFGMDRLSGHPESEQETAALRHLGFVAHEGAWELAVVRERPER